MFFKPHNHLEGDKAIKRNDLEIHETRNMNDRNRTAHSMLNVQSDSLRAKVFK